MKTRFIAKVKKFDINIEDGKDPIILLNEDEAASYGIRATDRVNLKFKTYEIHAEVTLTRSKIKAGFIGLYSDFYKKYKVRESEKVEISYSSYNPKSIEAIRKKILGQKLNEEEITYIVEDITAGNLSDTQMAYYVASSFFYEPDNTELRATAKAMADNGIKFKFDSKIVADKHCIGGVPGNRTTLVTVPIVASLGLNIPNTVTKAITSPSGTAEVEEVFMNVEFTEAEIYKLIKKNNCCFIWGGCLNIAPADDKIIKVTYPISTEPLSKAVISIMAKKIAMGITHFVLDLPVGKTAKIKDEKTALKLKKQFLTIASFFGIKMDIQITKAKEPIGHGIGPALEARDIMMVLQQHPNRPMDLEKKSVFLAGKLIELCGLEKGPRAIQLATEQLKLGRAWKKMNDIIVAQGGKKNLKPEDIKLGKIKKEIKAEKSGIVRDVDMKFLTSVTRALGCPIEKTAGMDLHTRLGHVVHEDDVIITLYAEDKVKMDKALKMIKEKAIYHIE